MTRFCTPYEEEDTRYAEVGAEAIGLPLTPQGEVIASVLSLRKRRNVIQMARRSAKTTSIASEIVGRCLSIDNYKVVSTAQSRQIARLTWLDIATALETNGAPVDVRLANGTECLTFTETGSTWKIAAPKAAAFRSQAADLVWVDEAGEFDAEKSRDVIEGALPLMDTRPNAQFVVSGTPGLTREGMLWDALQTARSDPSRYGIVDYSLAPGQDPTDPAVWMEVHPGLASGLTSLDIIQERYDGMPLESFVREYLCGDPIAAGLGAIDPEDWSQTASDGFLDLPQRDFALAYAVGRDDASGAVCAAWWTPEGRAAVQVLEHKSGIAWMPKTLARLLEKTQASNAPLVYDTIGQNVAVATDLNRHARPADLQRLFGVGVRDAAAGTTLFLSALTNHELLHAPDPSLDTAAEGASLRYVNDSRVWARRHSKADTSPLEACSLALGRISGLRPKPQLSVRPKML